MPDLALSSAISVAPVLPADTVSVRRNSLYHLDEFHSYEPLPNERLEPNGTFHAVAWGVTLLSPDLLSFHSSVSYREQLPRK
jgi:hypothetical protein